MNCRKVDVERRKGEKGAMVLSALEFDKAMAIFKELTGSK